MIIAYQPKLPIVIPCTVPKHGNWLPQYSWQSTNPYSTLMWYAPVQLRWSQTHLHADPTWKVSRAFSFICCCLGLSNQLWNICVQLLPSCCCSCWMANLAASWAAIFGASWDCTTARDMGNALSKQWVTKYYQTWIWTALLLQFDTMDIYGICFPIEGADCPYACRMFAT